MIDHVNQLGARRQLLRARRALAFNVADAQRPDLGMQTMAVLFTDLIGSTAMYARTGDAHAFRVVAEHFSQLNRIVERARGAVIKTVGDGVMAAFRSPADCLGAALAMDESVRGLGPDGANLRVRVGFALGPCISMRSGDFNDYFGTTVNLAARLQAKAGSGEVLMPRDVASRADVRAVLRASGRQTSSATLGVRGLTSTVDVVRVLSATRGWIPQGR